MIYYEQATFSGKWTPVTAASAPAVHKGREKLLTGVGKRIRPGSVCEVHRDHEGYSLKALWNYYSLDGNLKPTTKDGR